MFQKYKDKLYCFSPPVMLATFIIEFGLAFYAIWRYKTSTVKRLAVVMLFALGIFQLSEYMMCGGLGVSGIEWARVGYGSIALLPAMGIHMTVALSGKKIPSLVKLAYASCIGFVVFYLLGQNAVSVDTCATNYAIFHMHKSSVLPFVSYYYGLMMAGAYLSWHWSKIYPKRKKALQAMSLGYLAFMMPTTTVNIINPNTINAIPSIMCGFAVIFAITLVAKVLPSSCEIRSSIQDLREKFQFGNS